MAHSGKERHRDREPRARWEEGPPAAHRVFRITEAERQQIARHLRFVDEARLAIEAQRNPVNREIIRELRASADGIFDLLNGLERIE